MKITLSQIEAFFWVAQLGSIHAAARHLHLTQPAVSSRIRELESQMDVALFERVSQRVLLTETGRLALKYAEKVLQSSQQLEHLGRDRSLGGRLRLGADECSATMGLTAVITQIKERYPSLSLEITVDVGSVLNRKLNRKELDIALLTNPESGEYITDIFLGLMPFRWVSSPGMPISSTEPFTPEQAGRFNIATHSPPSTLYSVVERWLASNGVELSRISTSNSLALISRLVISGHAIGILPLPLLHDLLSAGLINTLKSEPPIPPAKFYISYLTESHDSYIDSIANIARETLIRLNFLTPALEKLSDV